MKTKFMLHPRARRGFKCLAAAASLGALAMAVVPQNAMAASAAAAPPGMKIVAVDGGGNRRGGPVQHHEEHAEAAVAAQVRASQVADNEVAVREVAVTCEERRHHGRKQRVGFRPSRCAELLYLRHQQHIRLRSGSSRGPAALRWKNSSYSDWLGSKPFNATTVDASMSWWVSGVNVSPSLPAGAGFSAAGSGITWNPSSVNNTYYEQLSYQAAVNINATHIFNEYFTDQADFPGSVEQLVEPLAQELIYGAKVSTRPVR